MGFDALDSGSGGRRLLVNIHIRRKRVRHRGCPANPFSALHYSDTTPTIEATNPFSPPASVIGFSLGDAAATGFGDGQQELNTHSSLANSAIDLQQRCSVIPREAFLSPQACPLTIVYPSGNHCSRPRFSRCPSPPPSR